MTVVEELTQYLKTIETFDKDASQDAQALYAYLINLSNWMARAGFIMAGSKRLIRQQKELMYEKVNSLKLSPSLAKDYLDSINSELHYTYELAERCSRCCVHTGDSLRTIISSLKNERNASHY